MTRLALLWLLACSAETVPETVTVAAPPADAARADVPSIPPESDALGVAAEPPLPPALTGLPGRPDRVATSPDGTAIAFVSGATGIASVYVVPAAGGAPVQLTNVGLEALPREPGQAPPGFVPPPHRDPPRFDGDELVWEAPDGTHRARWR